MSRDIRFRAWDKKGEFMLPNVQNHIGPVDSAFGGLLRNDRYEIMQWTGLKDKNGTPIFEGDYVECKMSYKGGFLPHAGVVVFDEKWASFGTKNEAGTTLMHNHLISSIEVIGNIHQHPSLLDQPTGEDV